MTESISKPTVFPSITPVRSAGKLIRATPYRPKHPKVSIPSGNACYPNGEPENINYETIDEAGRELIKELNKRPWISTIAYCSGHPQDRHVNENTKCSRSHYIPDIVPPKVVRWNFYEELYRMTSLGSSVPPEQLKEAQKELAKSSITEFYLSYRRHPFDSRWR